MPIDIFIKRAGSLEVHHRKVEVVELVVIKREFDETFGEGYIFLEDEDEPLAYDHKMVGHNVFLHHSHCRHVEVTVRYAGKPEFHHRFAPGATLKKVKRQAEKHFEIDPADAAELSLQIVGTTTRPDEETHVGSLVSSGACAVGFDLVPSDRING